MLLALSLLFPDRHTLQSLLLRRRASAGQSRELRERVRHWVGIPTCVGIAPTKTIAKVANFIAKKRPQYLGVCDLRSNQVRAELLTTVPVDEVWGIGAASAAKLARLESRQPPISPHSIRTMRGR
jgi:nucleotidyltransferase/DNA polymerase involved in DNA repair